MRFVLASSNAHKAAEIAGRLPAHISVQLQSELGVSPPPEPAATFVENALLKARHASAQTGLPAIADDSGICVAALHGAPGVRSARYAGENATDRDNIEKLLAAMAGQADRAACFISVLVCLDSPEDPTPIIARGRWAGFLGRAPAGTDGFGYDPIFRISPRGRTAAELTADEKHRLGHRGQALRELSDRIHERYPA